MMVKPLISVRLKPEIDEELKARAAKDRRPLSQLVSNLIEDHLAIERQQAQRGAT
jgi:predicted DNA-binding protein